MLHLIQPRFRMIFGEHYYRTVIADLQRTPDSMVVHAYVLLDPDKDNLYHSYTVWWDFSQSFHWTVSLSHSLLSSRFSSEGHVKFGKWILFPANIHVERSQLVPNRFYFNPHSGISQLTSGHSRYWKYLSDRSYFAPMAFSTSDPLITITLPAFFAVMSVILLVVGILSVGHYLAYIRGGEKLTLSQT